MIPRTSSFLSVTDLGRTGYPSSLHFVCEALLGEQIIHRYFFCQRKEGLAAITKT